MTKEEAIQQWEKARYNSACSCHLGQPPCGFCMDGYSLPLDEYLEEFEFEEEDNIHTAYDRAMGIIK